MGILLKKFIQKLTTKLSQSAVDGYALCCHAEDLNNQKFQVTGEIRAGSESHDILSEGQAIYGRQNS